MQQREGTRALHGEERSKTAIRAAKDFLAEAEGLAGAVGNLVRANLDDDPQRITRSLADRSWPPRSTVLGLPVADIQRACRALRQVESDWRALPLGDSLRFGWSLRKNPCAPENPLDARPSNKGRTSRQRLHKRG
jgi:hypothetical protein